MGHNASDSCKTKVGDARLPVPVDEDVRLRGPVRCV